MSLYAIQQSHNKLHETIKKIDNNKLNESINSDEFLPRHLTFIKPKRQQNAIQSTSTSSDSSTFVDKNTRQRSAFNGPTKHLYPESKVLKLMKWDNNRYNKCNIGSGLRNLGNSCFMNSTIQCLCYTPALQNYIKSNDHKKHCNINTFCFFCEFHDTLSSMIINNNRTETPTKIFRNLPKLSKSLTRGRQEDSHEYLRHLMDSFQNSSLKCYKKSDIKNERNKETTIVHKIWGGYLRSQVKCLKCGYESNSYESILDLSLEIKGNSVLSAIKHFTEKERLDGDNKYRCDKCKKLRKAVKQFTIFEPPNILVLHLKRFEFAHGYYSRSGKINKHIQFDNELDITKYLSYQTQPKVSYSLIAVLVHYGSSPNSGHYVAYVKSWNNNWYLMDDSSVSSVDIREVLRQKAYILFYMRNEAKIPYKSPNITPKKSPKNSPNKRKGYSNSNSNTPRLIKNVTKNNDTGVFKIDYRSKLVKLKQRSQSRSSSNSLNNSIHNIKSINNKSSNSDNNDDTSSDVNDILNRINLRQSLHINNEEHISPSKDVTTQYSPFSWETKNKKKSINKVSNKSSKSRAKKSLLNPKLTTNKYEFQTKRNRNNDNHYDLNITSLPKKRKLNNKNIKSDDNKKLINGNNHDRNVANKMRSNKRWKSKSKLNSIIGIKKRFRTIKLNSLLPKKKVWNKRNKRKVAPVMAAMDETHVSTSSDSIFSGNECSTNSSTPIIDTNEIKNDHKPFVIIHENLLFDTNKEAKSLNINTFFNQKTSHVTGLNVDSWNNNSNSIERETEAKEYYGFGKPLVKEKDKWDIELDQGILYPKNKKNKKKDRFKMNNNNLFQDRQNIKLNGNNYNNKTNKYNDNKKNHYNSNHKKNNRYNKNNRNHNNYNKYNKNNKAYKKYRNKNNKKMRKRI